MANFATGQPKLLAGLRQAGRNVFVAEISSPSRLGLDEVRDRNAKHLREPIQDAGGRGWPFGGVAAPPVVTIGAPNFNAPPHPPPRAMAPQPPSLRSGPP